MEWEPDLLYNKSSLFMRRAHDEPLSSNLFALWTSLGLELLCRAALAHIHPVLLADPREDGNLLYAFGIQPAKPPKSVVTKAIVIRCSQLVSGFTDDMAKHCALMSDRRNAEIHSGIAAFDAFENSAWLPATYEVVDVLLKHMGRKFGDFLEKDHADTAQAMLQDRRETIKKEVFERISSTKKFFLSLHNEDREERIAKATDLLAAAMKVNAVRKEVPCPSCELPAAMSGKVAGRGPVRIDESTTSIEREVRILPTSFRCFCCDLALKGFQEMRQAGLGGIYTVQEQEDPVEFFGIDPNDYIDPDEFLREHYGAEYDNE